MPTVALWFKCAPDRPNPDNGVYRVHLGASPTPTTIDQTITPGVRDDAWIEISVSADPGDYVRVSYDREDGTRYYSNSVQPFPPAPLDSTEYTLAATVPEPQRRAQRRPLVDSSAYTLAATVPDFSAGASAGRWSTPRPTPWRRRSPDLSAGPDPAGDCDTVTVDLTGYVEGLTFNRGGTDNVELWEPLSAHLGQATTNSLGKLRYVLRTGGTLPDMRLSEYCRS